MNTADIRSAIIIARDKDANPIEVTEARFELWKAARGGQLREDKKPRYEYLDLICEIQRNSVDKGMCHVGEASGWCISGKELEDAIASLYEKRQTTDSLFI